MPAAATKSGTDGYVTLAAHLYGLSRGVRRPLWGVSQRKAWRYLSELEPSLVREFRDELDAVASAISVAEGS